MKKLMNNTLVVNQVIYKGKIFKAFIITNADSKSDTMPESLEIRKIFVISDASLNTNEVWNALINFFGPVSAEQKDKAITEWLNKSSDLRYIEDMLQSCKWDNKLNIDFHNALMHPEFNVKNIVIL